MWHTSLFFWVNEKLKNNLVIQCGLVMEFEDQESSMFEFSLVVLFNKNNGLLRMKGV